MVRANGTLPYHCYRATSTTDARIGCVPTVTTPPYRCVGQFANTGSIVQSRTGRLASFRVSSCGGRLYRKYWSIGKHLYGLTDRTGDDAVCVFARIYFYSAQSFHEYCRFNLGQWLRMSSGRRKARVQLIHNTKIAVEHFT
jgi:hypothetical protein